jgi:hypothetical protein
MYEEKRRPRQAGKKRELLRDYHPEPLAPALHAELQGIIAAAEKEFIS